MQDVQNSEAVAANPATGATGVTGATVVTGPTGGQLGLRAKVVDLEDRAQRAADVATAMAVKFLPSAVGVLFILVVAWFVANWSRTTIRRGMTAAKFDPTLGRFLANVLRWTILGVALVMCLKLFGVEPAAFAAVIAAAGLTIGLAFQGSLSNLAAGIMLLLFRPFKVGDAVNVAGQGGTVNEIDLMMTEVDTADGRRVIIPNSQIFGAIIENITYHPRRRVDLAVGVSYAADIDQTRAVLERVARSIPGALADPAPGVALTGLGDSSVNWLVMVWAKRENFGDVRQATIRAVKLALDEAGIEIPFPQRDVWVRTAAGSEALAREGGGK